MANMLLVKLWSKRASTIGLITSPLKLFRLVKSLLFKLVSVYLQSLVDTRVVKLVKSFGVGVITFLVTFDLIVGLADRESLNALASMFKGFF